MESITHYFDFLVDHPLLQTCFWVIVLIIGAIITNYLVRHILVRIVFRLLSAIDRGTATEIRDGLGYLANIAPTVVAYYGIAAVPSVPKTLVTIVQNVSNAVTIFVISLAISCFLDFAERVYGSYRGRWRNRSIKGLVQVTKIVIFVVAGIFIIATLIDKSPLVLLSGLGAMAAVILLISQDTLLSFVAGIQISATDMVRLGDWITVPSLSADGDVVDIALHTVKVQNFDNTITTVPTRKLVTDSFINWRGMQESGARRIKRALKIDQTSIGFLSDADCERLSQFRAIHDYIEQKQSEIAEWNKKIGNNPKLMASARRMTNIGTFRAYVVAYLRNHPSIKETETLIVRQMEPTATGLPLEIYCFTNTVNWVKYEGIQSDIFDHLYSILPTFGLKVFQEPNGNAIRLFTADPVPVEVGNNSEHMINSVSDEVATTPVELPTKGPR